jgi:putative oxidoreductase
MNLSTRLTPSAGLLILRIVVGTTFLLHGIDKLTDLSATEQFFASLDIPAVGLMAPLVAVTETAGGALLIAELVLLLCGACLAFVLAGAGRYSVDARIGL